MTLDNNKTSQVKKPSIAVSLMTFILGLIVLYFCVSYTVGLFTSGGTRELEVVDGVTTYTDGDGISTTTYESSNTSDTYIE